MAVFALERGWLAVSWPEIGGGDFRVEAECHLRQFGHGGGVLDGGFPLCRLAGDGYGLTLLGLGTGIRRAFEDVGERQLIGHSFYYEREA